MRALPKPHGSRQNSDGDQSDGGGNSPLAVLTNSRSMVAIINP